LDASLSVETSPVLAMNSTMTSRGDAGDPPRRKAGPLLRARLENSIKMTAMIGIGLIAIPTANARISPATSAMR
jgi:hypothetical protein